MKKLLFAVVLGGLAACHSAPSPAPAPAADRAPGAPTAQGAVQRFFAAVHAQDIQAMANVWGTAKGPARENMDRPELEKRTVILQCYFNYDTFRILSSSPTAAGHTMFRVELTRGGKTRTPAVWTVQGPSSRWYVENLDIASVRDFCGTAPEEPGDL